MISAPFDSAAVVWLLAAATVLAIVVPYAAWFRRRLARDRERKEEAAALGIDRPAAQFPWIDAARCIGCGACVAACPERDVLGVVGGTATVINGLRCVGHARCEEACPVGAIRVGLGDLGARSDIPRVDEWGETDVPGLFLAGEVGGLALVRNAVAQGRRAVERIASRSPGRSAREPAPRQVSDLLDLLIVGAGPAGLAAALAAVEHGLRAEVLEQEADLGGSLLHYPRRKLVLLQPLELPLHGKVGREEIPKEALVELFEGLVKHHGLRVRFATRVSGLARRDGAFEIDTTTGSFRARTVLLALGRRGTPRKLGVPGEELPKVMYRLIDADSYVAQRVLVVGGGDSAIEAVIGLAREGRNRVTLSYRREKLVRIKKKNEDRLAPLIAHGLVDLHLPSELSRVTSGSVWLREGGGEREVGNDWVFVFAGGEPPLELLRSAGVRFGADAAA